MPTHQLLSVFLHVPESSHSSCQLCKVTAQCFKFGFLFLNVKINFYSVFVCEHFHFFLRGCVHFFIH